MHNDKQDGETKHSEPDLPEDPAAEAPSADASSGPPSTPADDVPVPTGDAQGQHDLACPAYFLNRELTWLNFQFRVLHESVDQRTPLLERVRYLAIVGRNLDEFFMKRIGGLMQQVGAGIHARTVDGRSASEQLNDCRDLVHVLEDLKRDSLARVFTELPRHGVQLLPFEGLDGDDRRWLRDHYFDNIYPLVTPQAIDPAHPFPFISNLSLNLLVSLRHPGSTTNALARVKVPVGPGTPRFLCVRDTDTFVSLENVMAANLDLLFPGMEINSCAFFRVTRNANTEQDEEYADDLMAMIESELRDRKFAPIVRLEVDQAMPAVQRGLLAANLGLDEVVDVFEIDTMLGMTDLFEMADLALPELRFPQHRPVDHAELRTNRNIFHIIRDVGPLLLHHPYQSFGTSVERLLREAAVDPKVRAIKMCLYRTSADTRAIEYLMEAARNGKQVAVVVELKARFDEAANIRWASRMEEAGIHVTYGVVGLKTHCKIIQVVRQDYNGLRRYAHIGTGNYHAGTARVYVDVGMLTCDEGIGADLTELLNYLTTGYKPKRNYGSLLPSPKMAKPGLIQRIQREVQNVAAGKKGLIQMKMNALEDPAIVRALYSAAQAGVHIDLIVRDTCRLRPGIPGLSENVTVISIVGRFLEHSRLFYFYNGGEEEYFIGSADAMTRNLNSRVEVLAPVTTPELQQELRRLLDLQLNDHRCSWEMAADGSYTQRQPSRAKQAKGCQELTIAWHEKFSRTAIRKKLGKGQAKRKKWS
ncbi:MAG: polyphosphate kinase [Pseudohongiellaceae bacterium]|jgi:polyphosphate kinase